MITSFEKYVLEGLGANTMERDPAELVLAPDNARANAMMSFSGTSGAIPTHWNNSPFLAGGRLTSAFGSNPRGKNKQVVLSYSEFIKAAKKFSK